MLAILAAVVLVVSAPIRRARMAQGVGSHRAGDLGADDLEAVESSEVAELEAARDAKYREIRDAELDHRTGKLSDADFEAVDRVLRAEAVEILHQLDRARAVGADGEASEPATDGDADAKPRGSSRI